MIPLTQPTQLTMTVMNCARCGRDHHMPLVFIAMERPIVENDGTVWPFFATCPYTLAPILAREVEHEHVVRQ